MGFPLFSDQSFRLHYPAQNLTEWHTKGENEQIKQMNKTSESLRHEPSLVQRPRRTLPPRPCWPLTVGLRCECGSGVVIEDCYQMVVVLFGTAERSWPSGLHRWVLRGRSGLPLTTSPSSVGRHSLLSSIAGAHKCKGLIQFQSECEATPKWKSTQVISIILLNIWSGKGRKGAKILSKIFIVLLSGHQIVTSCYVNHPCIQSH